MSNPSELILASSSPRRQELLRSLNLEFRIQASEVDESFEPHMAPAKVVELLSSRKAEHVANQLQQGIVIGSDTIVVLEGVILGKPIHEEDAFRMLSLLQGHTHAVYSGVTCIDASAGRKVTGHRVTLVSMKRMKPYLLQTSQAKSAFLFPHWLIP